MIGELAESEDKKRLRLLKRQQAALKGRTSLLAFTKFTSPDPEDPNDPDRSTYEAEMHHRAIMAAVEKVVEGEYQILILTVPPRHGKSEIVSRRLPAWFLGKYPNRFVAIGTYNDDFAKDFGDDVRGIMAQAPYKQVFPGTRITRGGGAKERLKTTKGGGAFFVGLGGTLTGRGAHLLIIDDLIKSDEEAGSPAYRNRAWNWFTKVAMTRRMGKKLVIITFTRWHQDDIIGRLTDPENEHYSPTLARKIKIIDIPALAGENDPLGRKPGEALWPGWYDEEFLRQQQELDPLGFEALYQQRPSLMDGDLFLRENIRYYDPETIDESELRIYCASDHAVTTKQRSDPTVLLRVGLDRLNNIYLLDCWWRKAKSDMVVEAMLSMATKDPQPLIWWAESGHISKSIGPFLKKRMEEDEIWFRIQEVVPAADKAQRAQAIAGRVAMGNVYFPKGAPWVERAVNQMMAFPNSTEDDFVDALSYIGLGLKKMRPKGKSSNKERPAKSGTLGWIKQEQRRQDLEARRKMSSGSFS